MSGWTAENVLVFRNQLSAVFAESDIVVESESGQPLLFVRARPNPRGLLRLQIPVAFTFVIVWTYSWWLPWFGKDAVPLLNAALLIGLPIYIVLVAKRTYASWKLDVFPNNPSELPLFRIRRWFKLRGLFEVHTITDANGLPIGSLEKRLLGDWRLASANSSAAFQSRQSPLTNAEQRSATNQWHQSLTFHDLGAENPSTSIARYLGDYRYGKSVLRIETSSPSAPIRSLLLAVALVLHLSGRDPNDTGS